MRTSRAALALLVWSAAAAIAYHLPWVEHVTAGFTMNGFDLAEWTSLHPAVRSSTPPLLATFLLRAPHVAAVLALACAVSGLGSARWRTAGWALALVLAARFIPPVEFFQSARSDPNYRQMALLTGLGMAGVLGVMALRRVVTRRSALCGAVVLGVGMAAGWVGLSRALVLLDNFEIAVVVGRGVVLYTAAALGAGVVAAWDVGGRQRGSKRAINVMSIAAFLFTR